MATLMTTIMSNRSHGVKGDKRGYSGGYEQYHGRGRRHRHGHGGYIVREQGRGRGESRRGGEFFHTHSNCAHVSNTCETPSPEYKNEATFTNIIGENQ